MNEKQHDGQMGTRYSCIQDKKCLGKSKVVRFVRLDGAKMLSCQGLQIWADSRRKAVSYTHLDVYKRQGLNNGGAVTKMEDQITGSYTYSYSFDGPAVLDDQGDGTGMTTVVANVYVYIPVSYTHLDVYKRQHLR